MALAPFRSVGCAAEVIAANRAEREKLGEQSQTANRTGNGSH